MKMSQVFLEFREPFLIYGEYCSCLLGAIDFLADICKKNQIIEHLVQVGYTKCIQNFFFFLIKLKLRWESLESMISNLSNDTPLITINLTDRELYAFTL